MTMEVNFRNILGLKKSSGSKWVIRAKLGVISVLYP